MTLSSPAEAVCIFVQNVPFVEEYLSHYHAKLKKCIDSLSGETVFLVVLAKATSVKYFRK